MLRSHRTTIFFSADVPSIFQHVLSQVSYYCFLPRYPDEPKCPSSSRRDYNCTAGVGVVFCIYYRHLITNPLLWKVLTVSLKTWKTCDCPFKGKVSGKGQGLCVSKEECESKSPNSDSLRHLVKLGAKLQVNWGQTLNCRNGPAHRPAEPALGLIVGFF